MPLVLGVDSSTTSTRVELRDLDDGRVFGSGQSWYTSARRPGEQDPAAWWQALVEARHDAGGALGVAAVAVAAQPGLVVVDDAARVLRPAKLWNDTDAESDALVLIEALGGQREWVHHTGACPTAGSSVAQLAWLRRTEPEVCARVARVLQPQDWLTFRLSREFVTDRGGASTTGWWSPREERWRPDLLALIDGTRDWAECLPDVRGPSEPAGDRSGVVIAPGTGALMAIALGLGARPRDVVISLDAPGCVFTVRERPTEAAAVVGRADATGRYLPCVPTAPVLDILGMFSGLLGGDAGRFDQLAQAAIAGVRGLAVVFDLDGRATLAGLGAGVGPEAVARAVLEGVACHLLDAVDQLRAADVPTGGRIFLVGDTVARGVAFGQVVADVFERPITLVKGAHVAAGACIQAGAAYTGTAPDQIADAWGAVPARELEPDPRAHADGIRAQYHEALDHYGGGRDGRELEAT